MLKWGPMAMAAVLAGALAGAPATPQKRSEAIREWTGFLEWLGPHELRFLLPNRIIFSLEIPPGQSPSPEQMAAAHQVGDMLTVRVSLPEANKHPTLLAIQFPASSDAERRRAWASMAWRAEGNLLPAPTQPPPARVPGSPPGFDPLRQAVLDYLAAMPNYIADESMTRSNPPGTGLTRLDKVESVMSWDGNHETREQIRFNGAPWPKSYAELPGMAWYGGFSGRLSAIFSRGCPNTFALEGTRSIAGQAARVYRFQADPDGCVGKAEFGFESVYPGSSGRVFLNPTNGNILRLEEQVTGLPLSFPISALSDIIVWGPVRIDNREFQLPLTSDATIEQGPLRVYHIRSEYKNYRRFGASTTITIH